MPDSATTPPGCTRDASVSASASSATARMLATTTGYVAAGSSSGAYTARRSPTPLRSALSAVASSACGSLSTPTARRAPSFSAAIARMPLPQPKSSTSRSRSVSPSSHCRHRDVVGCVPLPNARPGSRRITTPSAASAGVSRFHGTIHVRRPNFSGTYWSIHARSQSWSATVRNSACDRSIASSNDSSACSTSSGTVSPANSASSVISGHSGVSPTPGSSTARSFGVAASASSSVTDSAPRSISAFSARCSSSARTRRESSRKGIVVARRRSRQPDGLLFPLRQPLLEVMDVRAALLEAHVRHDPALQRHVRLDAVDDHLAERDAHPRDRLRALRAVHDQLADHRVVVRRDLVALVDVRVDAHAGAARRVEVADQAGRRHERLRILGVDAALDRVAGDRDVGLADRQLPAAGDQQLFLDEIDAGDHLGDRMLDLDARVHLDEVETPVLVQELERAGAAIADADARLGADAADLGALLRRDARRRRFLDDLLMPALHRAVALAEVHRAPLAVRQHLDLDVARVLEELLHVDHVVAERGLRFLLGRGDRRHQRALLAD